MGILLPVWYALDGMYCMIRLILSQLCTLMIFYSKKTCSVLTHWLFSLCSTTASRNSDCSDEKREKKKKRKRKKRRGKTRRNFEGDRLRNEGRLLAERLFVHGPLEQHMRWSALEQLPPPPQNRRPHLYGAEHASQCFLLAKEHSTAKAGLGERPSGLCDKKRLEWASRAERVVV